MQWQACFAGGLPFVPARFVDKRQWAVQKSGHPLEERVFKTKHYIGSLGPSHWKEIDITDPAKVVLKGLFHFKEAYIWDKSTNTVENRFLVVSKRKTKDGEEIKYSFTNASLGQYTEQALAYMQAQRFFVEHSFKEQKQTPGDGPLPDTQVAAVAPPNRTEHDGRVLHAQRKAVEPR